MLETPMWNKSLATTDIIIQIFYLFIFIFIFAASIITRTVKFSPVFVLTCVSQLLLLLHLVCL